MTVILGTYVTWFFICQVRILLRDEGIYLMNEQSFYLLVRLHQQIEQWIYACWLNHTSQLVNNNEQCQSQIGQL